MAVTSNQIKWTVVTFMGTALMATILYFMVVKFTQKKKPSSTTPSTDPTVKKSVDFDSCSSCSRDESRDESRGYSEIEQSVDGFTLEKHEKSPRQGVFEFQVSV